MSRAELKLSRLLDRAQVQLERAPDPETIGIYRRLVADLERIAGVGGRDGQ